MSVWIKLAIKITYICAVLRCGTEVVKAVQIHNSNIQSSKLNTVCMDDFIWYEVPYSNNGKLLNIKVV